MDKLNCTLWHRKVIWHKPSTRIWNLHVLLFPLLSTASHVTNVCPMSGQYLNVITKTTNIITEIIIKLEKSSFTHHLPSLIIHGASLSSFIQLLLNQFNSVCICYQSNLFIFLFLYACFMFFAVKICIISPFSRKFSYYKYNKDRKVLFTWRRFCWMQKCTLQMSIDAVRTFK